MDTTSSSITSSQDKKREKEREKEERKEKKEKEKEKSKEKKEKEKEKKAREKEEKEEKKSGLLSKVGGWVDSLKGDQLPTDLPPATAQPGAPPISTPVTQENHKKAMDEQTTTTTTTTSGVSPTLGKVSKQEDNGNGVGDEARKKLVASLAQFTTAYAESIKVTIDVFYQPLKKNDSLLTQDDLRKIFSVIESISGFNSVFLEDLNKVLNNWSTSNSNALVSIFSQFIGYLKLYKVYALLYNYSMSSLCSLVFNNTRFDHFVKGAEQKLQNDFNHKLPPIVDFSGNGVMKAISFSDILGAHVEASSTFTGGSTLTLRKTAASTTPSGKFTLDYTYYSLPSLLILPVHFLSRFNGFFKSLLDSMPKMSQDYKTYSKLFQQVGLVVKEIVTESNNINKVISISNSIKSTTIGLFNNSEVVQSRRLLKEGNLIEQYNNQRTTYYTFLFTDTIMFTEKIEEAPANSNLIAYEGSLYLLKKLERISNIVVEDPELGFDVDSR
eukprot:gene6722-7815_t